MKRCISAGFLIAASVFSPGAAVGQSSPGTAPTSPTSGQPAAIQQIGSQPSSQALPQQPAPTQGGAVQRPVGRADGGPLPAGSQPYAVGQNNVGNLFGYFGTPLYKNPEVGKSLGLTNQQLGELDLHAQRIETSYINQLPTLGVLTGPDGPSSLRKLRTAYHNQVLNSLSQIMTSEQLKRYRQLDLQYRGASALLDDEVRTKLNLADEQIQKLCELDERSSAELQHILASTLLVESESQRRYATLRDSVKRRIESILNKTQLKTWQDLKGQAFAFTDSPTPR